MDRVKEARKALKVAENHYKRANGADIADALAKLNRAKRALKQALLAQH